MPDIYYIIIIGGVICSGLILVLLLKSVRVKTYRLPNIMLSMAIFAWAWLASIYALVSSGLIVQVPNLYNKGIPLYYLTGPCAFLYVLFSLNPEKKFKWIYLLNFLPAFLAIIDILPYAFAPKVEKLAILSEISGDISKSYRQTLAFIPQYWHHTVRLIQDVIYLIFQWYILIKFSGWKNIHGDMKKWLYRFTILLTIIRFIAVFMLLRVIVNPDIESELFRDSLPLVALCVVFFLLSVGLFFRPMVLYGMAVKNTRKRHQTTLVKISGYEDLLPANDKTDSTFWAKMKILMEEQQLFRKKGLTLHRLSTEMDMQPHQLSNMLNKHRREHFNTYVNSWRIQYVINRLKQGDSISLKLEGLGQDAGFVSKNAFYNAFKKVTGKTPAGYIAELKKRKEL